MFPTECERCKISSSMEGCLRTSAVEIAVGNASYPDSSVGGQAPRSSLALAQFASGCGWLLSDTPTRCQLCCWRPAQLWDAVEPTASTLRLRRGSSGFAAFSTGSARTGTPNQSYVIKSCKYETKNQIFFNGRRHTLFPGSGGFFLMVEPRFFFFLVLFSFISPLTLPLIANSHGIV